MNKTQLQKTLAARANITQAEAATVLEVLFDTHGGIIPDALNRGSAVAIRGFGTFEVKQTRPRLARNPRTGAAVQVAAQRRPSWRPARPLKARLNG